MITRTFVLPKKIMAYNGNLLNLKTLFQQKEKQIGLNEPNVLSVKGKSFVVLDFGKEIRGGVRLLTHSFFGDKIRIRLGESVNECCVELGEKNAVNDVVLRDEYVQIFSHSDCSFFDSGFRFVRLDFPENCEAQIKNIYAYCDIFKTKPIYKYKGNDKIVNDIFLTAKRTVDLCVGKDYVWDGIKRDRLVWIGDLFPEMIALTSLYGKVKQIENSLDFARIQTPLPNWMNNIQTYSFWWVITLGEYFIRTKCLPFIKKQEKYLVGLVDLFISHIDSNGKPDYEGYFIDWQTTTGIEETCGGISLNLLAFEYAIKLYEVLNLDTKKLIAIKNKIFNLMLPDCKKKQIIGLKYMAFGKISLQEKENLLIGGAEGLSTFLSFAVLNTIAEQISVDKASEIAKEYYGKMLKLGATTFWEDFSMNWIKENVYRIDELNLNEKKDIHGDFGDYCYKGFRHSLCHGWSAGVIDFIKKFL